jgi:flagellar biogenesis protein FliO
LEVIQQAIPVCAVLALLAACLWFFKRKGMVNLRALPGFPSKARRLEVIERLQLTPQHALCLVRINKRTLLIATAPAGCHLLEKESESPC